MTFYHITTEQLLSIEDNLGHDHFVPILWENKWIVSVPHWYGDIPANWNYLDFEIYQDFKNNYEEGDNIDYSMFMRKVEITKEEVKKESWWVRFKKWFKNLFK